MAARLFLLLACLFLVSQPARAQDDYYPADPGQIEEPQPAPNDGPRLPSLDKLNVPDLDNQDSDQAVQELTAPAGEEAMRLAIQYYDNCMINGDKILSNSVAKATCGCKAQFVKNVLSVPQIKYLNKMPGGVEVDNKTYIDNIEAPCLEYPARQYAYNQCYTDKGITFTAQTAEQLTYICSCIGDKIADYFHRFALYQLDAIMLQTRRPITEPLAMIMTSSAYNSEYERARVKCSSDAQKLKVSPEKLKLLYRKH
jgi:hypothetical protein